MILYYAALPVHLPTIITHKLTINVDKRALLIVQDQNRYSASEGYKELERAGLTLSAMKESKIFDAVKVLDSFHFRETPSIKDQDFLKKMDNSLYEADINLFDFDEFIISSEWDFDFPKYLYHKKIPFTWIEPSVNNAKDIIDHMVSFGQKVGTYFKTPGNKVLLKKESNQPDLSTLECVGWDYNSHLKKLSEKELDKIKVFYNVNDPLVKTGKTPALILAQNPRAFLNIPRDFTDTMDDWRNILFGSFGLYKKEYSRMVPLLIYQMQLLLDIFAKDTDNPIIKWHPRAFFREYETQRIMNDSSVRALSALPTDFLSLKDRFSVNRIIGITSTSQAFSDYFNPKETLSLGMDHYLVYLDYPKLLVVLKFILESYDKPKIVSEVPYKSQIEMILKYYFEKEITVIEEKDLSEVTYDTFFIQKEINKPLRYPGNTIGLHGLGVQLNKNDLTVLELNKEARTQSNVSPMNLEYIYFHSFNNRADFEQDIFDRLYRLFFTISLPKTQNDLVLFSPKIEIQTAKISEQLQNVSIKKLESRANNQYRQLKDLEFQANTGNQSDLKSIQTFGTYLKVLNDIFESTNQLVVAVAVKDTAGYKISLNEEKAMRKIGFSDFVSSTWIPFSGIRDMNGKVVQKTGAESSTSEIFETINGIEFRLLSQPLKSGNTASIVIDSIDYAINRRGMNIVVFDTKDKKLIDSVAFDMHDPEMKVYRR
ncbi:hypothetical protein [Lactococcus ileimucosae]|uniref:hypothetical protein n=1 Tax=Lactococcus ileimucosae TaxID=2941329 RepID=UPI00351871DC